MIPGCARRIGSCLWLAMLLPHLAGAQVPGPAPRAVIERLPVPRGFCLLLGERPLDLAMELVRESQLLVALQAPDAGSAAEWRKIADGAGVLGRRIFVLEGSLDRLQLADDVVDLFVAMDAAMVPQSEALRVLCPGGQAWWKAEWITKPFPGGTDDWSHPYHGPDNNPQSRDQRARAPYLTHFLAEPWYSPMPLVTVAAGGRLFKAFGHIAIKQREWPLLNTLIAQNAFNGTVLWERPLSPNFMIHRNAMIATPETLYLADDVSCKRIDAATGKLRDEIVAPAEDGPVWKWLALEGGLLFALVGNQEAPDPTVRGDRRARGWPWGPPLGAGYNSKTYPWGFGQTIVALDPATKRVQWRHREADPIDTRAMCAAGGRIFFYCHGKSLAALDAKQGNVLWRTSDPEVLQAIGEHRFAQNPGEGFATSSYAKCDAQAIYFAGPTRTDLAAVSARDGKLLWRLPNGGNSQLVLREEGLYAMGPKGSLRCDPQTGTVLETIGPRVNCTRATGSCDSIFVRGGRDGTMRYDLVTHTAQHLSPMRPSCEDGVLVAHGHLFWGPWMCDCNLTLVGVVSLAPADPLPNPGTPALRTYRETPPVPFPIDSADWPTFRANNGRTAVSSARLPAKIRMAWSWQAPSKLPATAPVAAGGLVIVAGREGAVRALDATDGHPRWTAYTGGAITYPPSLAEGRVYVGSGDGRLSCLEAATGGPLWDYRPAPAERRIPVYGSLASTWPVASGTLVEQGRVFAAAGIANHDGTYVVALDAARGTPRWLNSHSGALDPESRAGVSVNGHLLLANGQLHLAGGNVLPVASYELASGTCVSGASRPKSHTQYTAGSDLFAADGLVFSGGPPLYAGRGDYRMVNQGVLQVASGDLVLAYGPHDGRLSWFAPGQGRRAGATPLWTQQPLNRVLAVALTPEAVVAAGLRDGDPAGASPRPELTALSLADGALLWNQPLPAAPVPWGLAIDRNGRVLVTLQDGGIVCFASAP